MNGYERRKQNKIEQIYSASLQLISEYGFQKASVHEIARIAKVSPATIYNYFGTKEQLYADLIMNWVDKQLEQYERILESGLSFRDKAKEIMLLEAKHIRLISDEVMNDRSEEGKKLAQLMESVSEEMILPFMMKFIAVGKQEGALRNDLTEETAMLYFNMYNRELSRLWEAADPESFARSVDQWMDLFFFGLVGEGRM